MDHLTADTSRRVRSRLSTLWTATVLCMALLAGISTGEGWAMTYYVSTDGDDSNPGTLDQPWGTVQKAADTLAAGDTVYIRGGVYRERVAPKRSGEPGRYITYASYPGETVVLDGSEIEVERAWHWGGLFHMEECSHIAVTGLRTINSPSVGIYGGRSQHLLIEDNYTSDTGSSGIGVWRCHGVVIHHNEVDRACLGRGQENITVALSDQVLVSDNHVHHGGKEGIDTKHGSSNVVVRGNHVHDNRRLGIYVDAWDTHTFNVDVVGNLCHDNGGCGFAAAAERGGLLENVRFMNNVAYHNRSAGIAVAGWNGGWEHPVENVQIINNTVFDNGWEEHTWGGGIAVESRQARSVLIRNNICSENRDFQIRNDIGEAEVVIDHNLVHGYRGGANETRGANCVEGDPLFVDPAQGDFHLQAGSPAVDAGAVERAPERDIEGGERPQGEGYDLGAYESG